MMLSLYSGLLESLRQQDAPGRLQTICSMFREGVVFSSSLGQEDQVLTDMIARHRLPIRVITLDTGRLFQETYELIDRTRSRYQLPVEVFYPDAERLQQLVTAKGMHSFYESLENRKECCRIRKVEPLRRALAGAKVWITGLRAEQSENRLTLPVGEWDESFNILKINPLVDWSLEEVLDYLQEHSVPYNTLHDRGFPSIGCAPCTRAIEPGEDIRAGRWWWEASGKECGLHAAPAHEAPARL